MIHSIRLLPLVIALVCALTALAPAAAPALAAGRDMVIGLSGDATSLNPVIATDGISYTVEWPMFDSLLELDASLNVKPLLAESWEVGKDGLTYTFKLKKGVTLARRQAVHRARRGLHLLFRPGPQGDDAAPRLLRRPGRVPRADGQGEPQAARGAGGASDRGGRRPHGALPPALSLGLLPGRARQPARRDRPRAPAEGRRPRTPQTSTASRSGPGRSSSSSGGAASGS